MKVLQILLLFFTLLVAGNAQEKKQLTELEGVIIDQAGAIISSTRIILTNSKGEKFESISNDDGKYLIQVPSGTYTVEAEYTEHQAWEKFKTEKFEIAATKKMRLDICLRVDEEFTRKHGTTLTSEPIKPKKKIKSP